MITPKNTCEKDIIEFLTSWKDGILDIGKAFRNHENYEEKAEAFIHKHYAFEDEQVLFKPTYTKDVIFRNDFDQALSYFISGNIAEDSGFAIKPWLDISATDINFIIEDQLCAVMGVLELKTEASKSIAVIAFTFVLIKTKTKLKIKIHHSSEISA